MIVLAVIIGISVVMTLAGIFYGKSMKVSTKALWGLHFVLLIGPALVIVAVVFTKMFSEGKQESDEEEEIFRPDLQKGRSK